MALLGCVILPDRQTHRHTHARTRTHRGLCRPLGQAQAEEEGLVLPDPVEAVLLIVALAVVAVCVCVVQGAVALPSLHGRLRGAVSTATYSPSPKP